MSRFSKIRKLDLSRITRTSGEEPLFGTEVMMSWKLEELILNGIPVNDKTLDNISAYLASDMSDSLRILEMDQCNLNGLHVAILMRSMTRVPGQARDLQLHVSANRLEKGVGEIVKAIEENHTPSRLVVRMIEFSKEDHFKQLLQALRTNTTIKSLDISKASLPYDAGPETCEALQQMFADNTTLEELDISGEHAHLEVTRFGIGLNQALTGLKKNKALKILRIEYQNLGLEGANTLSSVLEENTCLTHIHCEHNDINLQGFTILVNALAKNHTLLDLPFMQGDQGESMRRLSATMRDSRRAAINLESSRQVKSSVRRTLTVLGVSSKTPREEITSQDVDSVVRVLQERWDSQIERLAMFLTRNRNIAAGIEGYGPDGENMLSEDTLRPTTAMSDRGILEHVLSNTTPKVELGDPVDKLVTGMGFIELGGEENTKRPSTEAGQDLDEEDTPKKPGRIPRSEFDISQLPQFRRSEVASGRLPQLPPHEKMFELDGGELFEMES